MDGTGAEKPRLPVRRHLPQVPRAQRRRLLPGRVRIGRRNLHREKRLHHLQVGQHALPEPLLLDKRHQLRDHPRTGLQHSHRAQTRCQWLPDRHDDGTPRSVEERRQHVPDEGRHALHLAARLGNDATPRREQKPRRPLRTDRPHAGLQTHRRRQGVGAQPGRDHDRLPAGEVPATGQIRRLPGFDQRHAAFPYGRSLPQLRRSQSRAGHADAGRPRQDDQAAARTRRRGQPLAGVGQRQSRPLPGIGRDGVCQRHGSEQGRHPRNPPRTHRRTAHGELPLLGHHALERGQAFRKALRRALLPGRRLVRPQQRRHGRRLYLVGHQTRHQNPRGL